MKPLNDGDGPMAIMPALCSALWLALYSVYVLFILLLIYLSKNNKT